MRMEVTKLYTNAIFDSVARKLVTDQVITVSTKYGIILNVEPYNTVLFSHLAEQDEAQGIKVLDLMDLTILPGFVDVHVHSASSSSLSLLHRARGNATHSSLDVRP